ncbi:MAG: FlxA-like family protein [Caulobacteraceae bacterium]
MNITPVSTESNAGISSLSGNNIIKLLEKQKEQLQEQIQKTNESKLDDKAKQDRIKQLQAQIQQIDMEIQQMRSERLNRNNARKNVAIDSQTTVNNISGDSAENNLSGMNDLIQAASSYSNMKMLKNTKNKMQNSGQIIKTEIKLDGFTTEYKEKSLQSIESKTKALDKKLRDAVQTTQEHINKSAKRETNEEGKPVGEKESSMNQELRKKPAAYLKFDIKV